MKTVFFCCFAGKNYYYSASPNYFNREDATKCVKLLGYDENVLNSMNLEYPVQPAYLQSKIMEYRTKCME